jgi:hypothetical protein
MNAATKTKFAGAEMLDYFVAGTVSAFETLGANCDDVNCVVCGARIKHVFETTHGPMGGDCLATITGDSSTRRVVRQLTKAVETVAKFYNHEGIAIEIKPSFHGDVCAFVKTATRGQFNEWTGEQSWTFRTAKAVKIGQTDERIVRAIIQNVVDACGVAIRTN